MWSKTAVIGWVIILAVLIGYELWCALNGDPRTPPLTLVATRYLPWWAIMPFLTWLWLHFFCHYMNITKIPFLY